MTTVLALFGGLLALDQTSVGQFMASRPLVAGVATGLLLGTPETGLLLGAILELLVLPAFPVGGVRVPETGPATVVAVAAGMGGGSGGLAAGVLFGTLWAQAGGITVVALRRLNERLAPRPGEERVTRRRIERSHLGAVALDFLRGSALTGLGLWSASIAAPVVTVWWPLEIEATWGLVCVAAGLSLGGLLPALGGIERRWVFLVGGAILGLMVGIIA